MSSRYGDGAWRAELYERAPFEDVRRKRADMGNLASVGATRVLNGQSTAQLELPVPASTYEQARLRDMTTIRFEVDVWRDEDMLWSGVITELDYGRSDLRVTATDFTWWLSRRFIRERVAFEDELGADGTEDVAVIAQRVALSALSVDDPALGQYLHLRFGQAFAQARYEQVDRANALEAWDDLVNQGLDYTALGRLVLAHGGDIDVPDLPGMTDEDFLGELRVIERGTEACTRAAVIGAGITAEAGGSDPFYGLVERRFDAPATVSNQAVLDKMAADHVAARNPPPLFIQLPSGGALSPYCRVPPTTLIPGAVSQITVGYTLRPVSQRMRLSEVRFEKRGGDAEEVSVQFQPVGVLADDVL